MAHKYIVSVRIPKPKAIQPFDWEAHDAAIKEIELIIQNAMARCFRQMQSNEIRMLLLNRTCPKCRGRLFPSDDGFTCFTCGMIIYNEVVRDDATY